MLFGSRVATTACRTCAGVQGKLQKMMHQPYIHAGLNLSCECSEAQGGRSLPGGSHAAKSDPNGSSDKEAWRAYSIGGPARASASSGGKFSADQQLAMSCAGRWRERGRRLLKTCCSSRKCAPSWRQAFRPLRNR